MKATGKSPWSTPNAEATNSSGFTGLPGGYRVVYNGTFYSVGTNGGWWSSSENDTTYAWYRSLHYNFGNAASYDFYKKVGFSVRCLRD